MCVWGVSSLLKTVYQTNTVNPFGTYEAVMPGQPSTHLVAFDCQPLLLEAPYPEVVHKTAHCAISSTDGIFHLVVVESADEIIQKVTFYSEQLSLGDLMLKWGKAQWKRDARKHIQLEWDAHGLSISATCGRFRYESGIRIVTIESGIM